MKNGKDYYIKKIFYFLMDLMPLPLIILSIIFSLIALYGNFFYNK
tara:strand:+ start:554 stop:688 length:135 start_codon:yes stop_codon:yes gene_type:complete